jgi:hypothetical protein
MQVEVASGGFTLVREQLRLVRTEFFRTLADAVKEKSEALRIAEADIVCVSVNMPTNTEAGAADVNEELEVPAKVKREEM